MIWTKQWKVLTIENITNWTSKEVRTINITQGMGGSSYALEVREFVPIQGDLLEKFWTIDGVTKTVKMTAYAIVDIGIDTADLLIRTTYERASRHAKEAPREEEKGLLKDALYLWVAVRMSSTTEWIIGDEQLGMSPVTDLSSPYYNHTPIPPVMSAQGQIIAYSKILEPLKRSVVKQLASMSSATDTRKNWFTIYLTYFILLHSCGLVTRRDADYARQINAKTIFANPEAISDYHQGALFLLADFHYSNKGQLPFSLAENLESLQELADVAGLNLDQVLFMKNTAVLVRQKRESI
ncbi:hypothetical protein WAI453_009805 [Rhynchosporium graminicola]